MPTMNGLEFVRKLRESETIATEPVVFYTAFPAWSQKRRIWPMSAGSSHHHQAC